MAGTALIAEELTTNQSLYTIISTAASLLSSPSLAPGFRAVISSHGGTPLLVIFEVVRPFTWHQIWMSWRHFLPAHNI